MEAKGYIWSWSCSLGTQFLLCAQKIKRSHCWKSLAWLQHHKQVLVLREVPPHDPTDYWKKKNNKICKNSWVLVFTALPTGISHHRFLYFATSSIPHETPLLPLPPVDHITGWLCALCQAAFSRFTSIGHRVPIKVAGFSGFLDSDTGIKFPKGGESFFILVGWSESGSCLVLQLESKDSQLRLYQEWIWNDAKRILPPIREVTLQQINGRRQMEDLTGGNKNRWRN